MRAVETYDQAAVDRLCRAIAWAGGNETTATKLAQMSVDESGMGSPEPKRRAKVLGVLRDALRQKSMGVIEEIPDKGIVKYAKPAGVIASLIPVTSPYVTPITIAIYAIKCKDAVIFSPHPGSRKTTNETVRVMRAALRKLGAPEDLLQCVERPSIPLANELMRICDLTIATGGPAMVKSAYSSGKPAYGVGAGNATMVIDETADIVQAARNTADQQDQRSRIGLLRRRQHPRRRLDLRRLPAAAAGRGRLSRERAEKGAAGEAPTGTPTGIAPPNTIARAGVGRRRHRRLHDSRRQDVPPRRGTAHRQAAPLLDREARHRARRSSSTTASTRRSTRCGRSSRPAGKGHSCGIYSHDDDHIHRLALVAPVSRIMVRQVQSSSNAGTFTNGMPMTSSMGCGVWGGNITNENISLKHYMNVTWVSRPIPEDRPSEQELFGEFYNSETF